jgi:hypothetical protein
LRNVGSEKGADQKQERGHSIVATGDALLAPSQVLLMKVLLSESPDSGSNAIGAEIPYGQSAHGTVYVDFRHCPACGRGWQGDVIALNEARSQ